MAEAVSDAVCEGAALALLKKPRLSADAGAGADTGSSISVREASALEVFNIPLFETPPMLDVRSAADYEREHVVVAVSVPMEDGHERAQLLKRILDHDAEFGWCLQFPFVVVYDDSSRARADWLVGVLRETVSTEAQNVEGSGLLWRLCRQLQQILLLDHKEFACIFPACCAGGKKFSSDGFFDEIGAIPRCIWPWPRLLLAGRQVQLKDPLVRKLGITHAIVNADSMDVMDGTSGGRSFLADRVQDVLGIKYLKCDVPDENDHPDFVPLLHHAVEFLRQCAACHGCAVIRVHGQSRGASIACAWLMAERNLSPEEAWQAVLAAGIKGLDPQLVWWLALRRLGCASRQPGQRSLEDHPMEDTAAFG